jgi:ketol-acid reductoisomerase
MAQINFGGSVEEVVTREEFPLEKAREVLANETIAVIGYGVQGPGQGLNMRDNGFNVIVGQRKGKTYDKAVADGWVPGETLFEIEEALEKGTIICFLLSDAAQIELWPTVKKHLTAGKSLYFSHGFGDLPRPNGYHPARRGGRVFGSTQRLWYVIASSICRRQRVELIIRYFPRCLWTCS